jgi:hypothetical protein
MARYNLTLGPAATGRNKMTNQRHFRTRLPTGDILQVTGEEVVSVELSGDSLAAIESAATLGYVKIEEAAAARKPAARRHAASADDEGGDE